jgi:hypothetical protein
MCVIPVKRTKPALLFYREKASLIIRLKLGFWPYIKTPARYIRLASQVNTIIEIIIITTLNGISHQLKEEFPTRLNITVGVKNGM